MVVRPFSSGTRFVTRLIVDDITIIQVGSYKGFINSKQVLPCRGESVLSLRRRPTPFKVLLNLSLMQLVKDIFSSRVSPMCLLATDLSNG